MKKIILLAFSAFAALSLAACSSGDAAKSSSSDSKSTSKSSVSSSSNSKSSSSTSPSSSASTSSSNDASSQAGAMNLAQISAGDYSSVVGTWKNNQGHTVVFTDSTITSDGNVVTAVSSSFYNDRHLTLTLNGYAIDFYNAGERNTTEGLIDNSDASKDRVFVGQGWTDGSDAYYKVN